MYYFPNLDETTRLIMISELEEDMKNCLFFTPTCLTDFGATIYPKLLLDCFSKGSVDSLIRQLTSSYFRTKYPTGKKVPANASKMIAFSDFNRYYLRALILRAIEGKHRLVVYRAKHSEKERFESKTIIGKMYFGNIELHRLLSALRDVRILFGKNNPVEFFAANSGLSLRLF